MTWRISLKEIGVHTLAETAYGGYRVGMVGLGIRVGKQPSNHSYRQQHARAAALAVKRIMKDWIIHRD